ncbi:hypothetical protein [Mammaliicoccus sciuri]|uniref:hypothetical protein n=1 Tax=Mammaliicoccus sciuri TaxID=1296 RepID=UPI000D1FA46C|nr:hypothetical protein [Mammaliicoccus sciuri]MCD8788820.1 hypothetical protein [Mammaliicoccus sciuri]MCD8801538.1 hypothetical protein [Mammaliicoccus sciuri]PTK07057.1 hypothetical protein BU001_12425 [Mammaliicoccus sciuri]
MNESNNQKSFSDISLILGSLIFGILLTTTPLGIDNILPLIIINKVIGIILLTFSMIGMIGSNEVRENMIGNFLLESIILLFQLFPIISIIVISYNYENNWFILIIKYVLLLFSFLTSIFIINKFLNSFKKLSFNGTKDIIESAVKIITCIVGLGTLIFQIIKFLSSGL